MRDYEPTISCVLPWQGSAEALRHHVLPLLDDVSALVRLWELILVDDGCSVADATAMAAWAQKDGIRIVRLKRRFGRDAAIAAGLRLARGDLVVVLQGDDVRASELLAGLLVRWRQGFDVVHSTEPHAQPTQSVASRFVRWLRPSRVSGNRLAAMRTAHRALLIDRSAVQDLALPQARAPGSSARPTDRPLQIATVPTPPLLVAEPSASVPDGGFGAALKKALGIPRAAGRSLGNWRSSSAIAPVFEIQYKLGSGLAPRPHPSAAEPHA